MAETWEGVHGRVCRLGQRVCSFVACYFGVAVDPSHEYSGAAAEIVIFHVSLDLIEVCQRAFVAGRGHGVDRCSGVREQ